MKVYKNLDDLAKYMGTPKGQTTFLNEKEIVNTLTKAGKRLEELLKDELRRYFESYNPVEYTRTGYTEASIRVGQPKKISINEWSLEIYFDEGLANHPSYIGQDQPDGYTPWLLHSGWRTKLDSSMDIENFTRFKGTNYITKAVDRFNRENKYGIKVNVYHGGTDVTDKSYSYGK